MTPRECIADAIPIRSDEMLSSEIADAILAALTAAGFPPRSDAEAAAAVLAEREACAAAFRPCPFDDASCDIAETEPCPVCGDLGTNDAEQSGRCGDPEAIIRARPAPDGADALAAMLAQAKGAAFDEGRESAFAQMRRPGEIETNMAVGHLPRDWFDAKLAAARREGIEAAADVCDELHEHTPGVCAAAIRALLPALDAALVADMQAWTDGGTHE